MSNAKRAPLAVIEPLKDGGRFQRPADNDGPIFSIEPGVVVPPGVYQMAFVSSRTAMMFQRAAKLALRFRIVDPGPHFGVELERWYNVQKLLGPQGKGGRFKPGRNSDFVREYLTLFPGEVNRLDRMSFKPFRSTVVRARVDTVKSNRGQKVLPDLMHYSVVRELLGAGA